MTQTARPVRRRVRSAAALLGAATLVGLSGSPAAAATVAQASGTAVRVSVAGNPADSGSFRSVHDGDREQTSGSNRPAVALLGGQDFLTAGTLAQDARTRVQDGRGYSEACAGLAGDGATVVGVGEGTCLQGGQNLQLSAGTVDLSGLEIVGEGLPVGPDDLPLPADQLGPLTEALNDAVDQVSTQLGNPGLFLDLGAVQSRCTSGPGTAEGSASIVGARAYAQFQGRQVDLVRLPVSPPPNTKVVTDLGAVSEEVRTALRTQLETGLDGALGPLAEVIDQGAAIDAALAQISEQLAPLEQNLLDVTLNKQVRQGADQITVTALDAQVLPVAAEQLDASAVSLQIGESACGPSGQVTTTQPTPTPDPTPAGTAVGVRGAGRPATSSPPRRGRCRTTGTSTTTVPRTEVTTSPCTCPARTTSSSRPSTGSPRTTARWPEGPARPPPRRRAGDDAGLSAARDPWRPAPALAFGTASWEHPGS
ncbi:hypothetical protein [Nocardioides sp. AX2bis]|uniref:hypothetical protein n=1 Tax=Nocardioides sp. AX2bis TaxID=2653157 RepID=UPI0012F13673|nr:hypothetical protein [Nocardioides sp. AX2bis]VXC34600.1 conserved exported hypothetical protein [Nocardioides sp. AX2bis]